MRRSIAYLTLVVLGLFPASSVYAATYSATLTILFGDPNPPLTVPNTSLPWAATASGTWSDASTRACARCSTRAGGIFAPGPAMAVSGPSTTLSARSLAGTGWAAGTHATAAGPPVSDVTPVQITVTPNAAFAGISSSVDAAFARLSVAFSEPVPEPATFWPLAAGILGLAVLGNRRER